MPPITAHPATPIYDLDEPTRAVLLVALELALGTLRGEPPAVLRPLIADLDEGALDALADRLVAAGA